MSAIAGIVHFHKEQIKTEEIHSVMSALQKFPANDIRVWQNDQVFFGCHAQWITPESIGEPLPFYDSERQCTITTDAIIDNREELFERLQVDRSKRKTMPDSQLILLAYYKWGEDSPKYLVGDFAFMIWDEREKKLFGARDFSGSRTLYYYRDHQRVAFCTVMMPLFTLPYIKKELNEEWLAEFLAIPDMFNTVDIVSTVYMNVLQVPPSHSIIVSNESVKLLRYSVLRPEKKLRLKSNQEYEEAFLDIFQESVNSRLRTNQQVGSHLSGGLDSGSVVSYAARELKKSNKKLYTFSSVPVDDFVDWTPKRRIADERPFIKLTVEHVGNIADHYLSFDGRNPYTEIDDWLEIQEMPYKFFVNSVWIKGIYEEARNNNIGVLLNGARGNYTISFGSALDYYARLLKRLRWAKFYHEIQLYSQNIGIGKKTLVSIIGKKAFPSINNIIGTKDDYLFPNLINDEFAKKTNVYAKLQESGIDPTGSYVPNTYEARKAQFEKLFYWGNGTSGTNLSLRYSLWNRDPTNDLRVIRFCLDVPDSQYIQNGVDRSLIRRSTKNLLPDKVRLNQRYRGVQGVDSVHRMNSSWSKLIEEILQMEKDPIMSGYLNSKTIKEALLTLQSGPRPEYVFNVDFKLLMRSVIVYRFIKNTF